jgi:hypothetical protein
MNRYIIRYLPGRENRHRNDGTLRPDQFHIAGPSDVPAQEVRANATVMDKREADGYQDYYNRIGNPEPPPPNNLSWYAIPEEL